MQNFTFNFNKKLYQIKKLNDFYFQITLPSGFKKDLIPQGLTIISDLETLLISFSKFCPFCLKNRYLCWKNKEVFLSGGKPKTLQYKNWTEKIDKSFIEKLIFCVSKFNSNKKKWDLWSLAPCKLEHSFDLISYDICPLCNKRNIIQKNSSNNFEQEGQKIFDAFSTRLKEKTVNNYKQLSKLFEEDSFGLITFLTTFKGSGLPDDFLENTHITTLLSAQPSFTGEQKKFLCGGVDEDANLSKLKATMEFVERYSLKNISYKSSIMFLDKEKSEYFQEEVLDNFINLFSKDLVNSDWQKIFKNYLVCGIDLLENKKALIPLQTMFNATYLLKTIGVDLGGFIPKPTTNGFAAHFSANEAIKNSVFELIERDAFARWWMNPAKATLLKVPKKFKSKLNKIVSVLNSFLDSTSIKAKLLLLPSPLGVPVVFAFITSRDKQNPPALLVGASANFDFESACKKAIDELSIAALNFIARYQKDPNWIQNEIDLEKNQNIKSPEDHAYLYHYPKVLSQLKFLDKFFNLKEVEALDFKGPKNIEELKIKMKNLGMNWYVIDATPEIFKPFGVFLARSFVPQLYSLYFGDKWHFDLKEASNISVADRFPHCFP